MERTRFFKILRYFMPEKIRHAMTRRALPLPSGWPSELVIKLARTELELTAAFRLLHDCNVRAGYLKKPLPSKMCVLTQHMLPQATTVIAIWQGTVVGTVSLIRDNPFGLPMDRYFNLSSHRTVGKRLAEVSCLALDPRFQGEISCVLLPMLRFLYYYARYHSGMHEVVITVPAWKTNLYQAVFGFKPLQKGSIRHEAFNRAPTVGLVLELKGVEQKWEKIVVSQPERKSFLQYMKEIANYPGNIYPTRHYLSAAEPALSPGILKTLMLEKAELSRVLTNRQIAILRNVYHDPCYDGMYAELFPEFQPPLERDVRIDVRMPAQVVSSNIRSEVWNASMGGAMLSSKRLIPPGQTILLWVQLNHKIKTQVKALVRWNNSRGLHGLQVVGPSAEWVQMMRHLEMDFRPPPDPDIYGERIENDGQYRRYG